MSSLTIDTTGENRSHLTTIHQIQEASSKGYQFSSKVVNRGADALSLVRQVANFSKSVFPGIVTISPIGFQIVASFKLTNVLQLPFVVIEIFSSIKAFGKAVCSRDDILEIGAQFCSIFGNIGDFAVTGAAGAEAIIDFLAALNTNGAAEVSAGMGPITVWFTGIGAIFMLALIAAEGCHVLKDLRSLYRASKAQKKEIEDGQKMEVDNASNNKTDGKLKIYEIKSSEKIFKEYLGKESADFKRNLSQAELDKAYSLLKQRIALKIVSRLLTITTIIVFFVAIVFLVLGSGGAHTAAGYALLAAYYVRANGKTIGNFVMDLYYQRKTDKLILSVNS